MDGPFSLHHVAVRRVPFLEHDGEGVGVEGRRRRCPVVLRDPPHGHVARALGLDELCPVGRELARYEDGLAASVHPVFCRIDIRYEAITQRWTKRSVLGSDNCA